MARDDHIRHWFEGKWGILAAWWVFQVAAIYFLGGAWVSSQMAQVPPNAAIPGSGNLGLFKRAQYLDTLQDPRLLMTTVGLATAMMAGQLALLWPVRRPAGRAARGWPLTCSLALAGLIIAVMSLALVTAVVGFGDTYDLFFGADAIEEGLRIDLNPWWVGGGWLAISWLLATPLLLAFCRRGPRESLLSRLSARLFLGTILEIAAIVPLDVLVRKRESCYCAAGTYLALSMLLGVGLFLLGPAILLLVIARRRKRWYDGRCDACAYDLAGLRNPDRCPECGAGWRPS